MAVRIALLCLVLTLDGEARSERPLVTTLRVPGGGIQPQTATDEGGVVHLVYFKGDPKAGDIYYVKSEDGVKFGEPIRINSHTGSVVALGNIRGAHLALGPGGRPHVAWIGSHLSKPKAAHGQAPMLYTRLAVDGKSFESQRNMMARSGHLDGGGSVAADEKGNVYVVWHGVGDGEEATEANRRVFIAKSSDEGATFGAETRVETEGTCACCTLRAGATGEGLIVLYRDCATPANRDLRKLLSSDGGKTFENESLDPWEVNVCPMSSAFIAARDQALALAWEGHDGAVFDVNETAVNIPGGKHPVVALGADGAACLAWTEGMGWNKGGAVGWKVFDKSGQPIKGASGRADGVPVWSLVAVYARPGGGFVVMY